MLHIGTQTYEEANRVTACIRDLSEYYALTRISLSECLYLANSSLEAQCHALPQVASRRPAMSPALSDNSSGYRKPHSNKRGSYEPMFERDTASSSRWKPDDRSPQPPNARMSSNTPVTDARNSPTGTGTFEQADRTTSWIRSTAPAAIQTPTTVSGGAVDNSPNNVGGPGEGLQSGGRPPRDLVCDCTAVLMATSQ